MIGEGRGDDLVGMPTFIVTFFCPSVRMVYSFSLIKAFFSHEVLPSKGFLTRHIINDMFDLCLV